MSFKPFLLIAGNVPQNRNISLKDIAIYIFIIHYEKQFFVNEAIAAYIKTTINIFMFVG